MKKFLQILATILISSSAFAACHTVSISGSGTNSGADWNNTMAGLPGTLTRGDIYYLADGTGYADYTFSESGTSNTEVRKAKNSDNCTSTGWNNSTMGSAQAVFNGNPPMFQIESPGFILNGNGQQAFSCGGNVGSDPSLGPGTPSDCGIKLLNTCVGSTQGTCANLITTNDLLSGAYTLKYIEIQGNGNATSESYDIRADDSTGTLITNIYMHYFGAVCVVADGTSGLTISYSYFWRNQIVLGANANHGQCIQVGNSTTNGVFNGNVVRDMSGTAAIASFLSTGTSTGWQFYTNAVWNTVGYTPANAPTDGIICCINSHNCTYTFAQNVVVGQPNVDNLENQVGGTITAENNIWYDNSNMPSLTGSGTYVNDHNSFLSTGASCPTGTGNVCDNSSPNPFTSWTTGIFTLASDNADWNNRAALGSPYNVDAVGNTFTTDRGAYQYVSAGSPASPSSGGIFAALWPLGLQ